MRYNGRYRWKCIKALAREGPIVAYCAWNRTEAQRQRMARTDPRVAEIITRRSLADRALAVTISRPRLEREAHVQWLLSAREGLASEGREWTPCEFESHLDGAIHTMTEKMRAQGTPIPSHPDAARELFWWMLKGVDMEVAG